MNTPLISMNKVEAAEKYAATRAALKILQKKAFSESSEVYRQYKAAEKAYKALAKGTQLIDIEEAFNACGFDERGRPKLAIGRADREEVFFEWAAQGEGIFKPLGAARWNPADERRIFFRNPPTEQSYKRSYALVPKLPIEHRPSTGKEDDWFILWEVDEWRDRSGTAKHSRDPYLLKHLAGTLYAVLAEWDLTDLELAIMKRVR